MTKTTDFQQIHVDEGSSVFIPSGLTFSNIYDCAGTQLCGFYAPEQLSGSNVTFAIRNKPDMPLALLYDGASPLPAIVNYSIPNITPGQVAYIPVSLTIFSGIKYIRFIVGDLVLSDTYIELAVRPT